MGRVLIVVSCLLVMLPAVARAAEERSWPDAKCARYRADWAEALTRRGATGLSPAGLTPGFLAANEAFLASGCTLGGHVCPRSPADFALADVMTIRLMNFGTASTFLPFGCKPAAPPLRPSP